MADNTRNPSLPNTPGPIGNASLEAQIQALSTELESTKAERNKMMDRERRIMELLGTDSNEHLVHDLRNVLNERELFRALAFRDETADSDAGE